MEITKDTKLTDILNEYPWLEKELVDKFPAFRALLNPIGRRFVSFVCIGRLCFSSFD